MAFPRTRIALLLLFALPPAGSAQESTFVPSSPPVQHAESGDAESFPDGTAQMTYGVGEMNRIHGETTGGGDLRDAYCIRIVDPVAFRATVDPRVDATATADFDTRLFLFASGGAPMLANDDTPPSDSLFRSTLTGVASDGSGFALPGAGSYILVVAGYASVPRDTLGTHLFDFDPGGNVLLILAANPAAGGFSNWAGVAPQVGTYTVALRGVAPCSPFVNVVLGDEFQVNSFTTGLQRQAAVSRAEDGSFVVAWRSQGSSGTDTDLSSIQGQRYDAVGNPLGSEFQINSHTTGDQLVPQASHAADGSFVVVWQSYGSSGSDTDGSSIQGQRYDSAGGPADSQFQINSTTSLEQAAPSVSRAADGSFVVVWHSFYSTGNDSEGYSIAGQRFNSAGGSVGSEFQVNAYTTGEQRRPSVGQARDGSFVVVWQSLGSDGNDADSYSIHGQRYDSTGNPAASEFEVNLYTPSFQQRPSVSQPSEGSFVVAWQSYGSSGYGSSSTDTEQWSVQARPYDLQGNGGQQVQVNEYTLGSQTEPRVSQADDGSFFIVWTSSGSNGNDDSDSSVQGRRFAAGGGALGSELQINSYTNTLQSLPSLSHAADGSFVAAWVSNGSSGTDGDGLSIQAQLFGVDSAGDGCADPDPACVFLDDFESGSTGSWSDGAP